MKISGSAIISVVAALTMAALLVPAASYAVPQYVNYQGALNDSEGMPLEGTFAMTLRFYDDPTSESEADKLWEEVQPEVIVRNGVYSIHLGSVTSFDSVQESKTGEFWLEVEVDGEVLGPRQMITSVFFAMESGDAEHADTAGDAESLGGRDSSDFLDKDSYDADRNAKVDEADRADSVGYAPLAGNADTVDNLHAYQLQERVTGVCPPGQSIRAVEPSGAVQCEADDVGLTSVEWADVTNRPADLLDGDDVGITSETDPNVIQSVWDGVSWDELSGIPAGFQDGVDNDTGVSVPLSLTGTTPSSGILSGVNTNTSGYGVYGEAPLSGLLGRSYSANGRGVMGYAHATSGTGIGVRGQSSSTSGHGVWGLVTAATGDTVGVGGQSSSTSGYGVSGVANASSGSTAGVHGRSLSTSGAGVSGSALATGGPAVGVRGESASSSGFGVWGIAASSEGSADGVLGTSSSSGGHGVRGNYSNTTTGHLGGAESGAYGEHYASGNYGHLANAASGAYGEHSASGNYGRLGQSVAGVSGNSTDQTGVVGVSTNSTGVYGGSNNGSAVHGFALNGKSGHFQGWGSRVGGASVYAENFNASGIAGYFQNESDDATAVLVQKGTGDVLRAFYDNGSSWEYAIRVQRNGWTTISVLELTGGADLSEQFDVSGPEDEAIPGMVVTIDPGHPGQLQVSEEAYDRKVAGIISGAGGVRPGMLMAQKGSQADGASPVALTGRVYCWVDASYGRIEPGDMLTTSSTPGHAMKAADHQRAQGAVIGKAMSTLEEGRGLVLVLVSLQ